MKQRLSFPAASSLLGLALLLLSGSARAMDFFGSPCSDLSVTLIIGKLFGGLACNGGSDPFVGMLGALNGAALMVGGVLAAYGMIAGTMSTAHDGEMLGKKFSSLWLPIRMSLGTAMVVPMGKGYCVAQMFVMWVALQGIGLANVMWGGFMDTNAGAGVFEASMNMMMSGDGQKSASSPGVQSLASNLLRSQVCVKSYNQVLNNPTVNTGLFNAKGVNYGMKEVSTENGPKKFSFGATNAGLTDFGVSSDGCGSYTIPMPPTVSVASSTAGSSVGSEGFGVVYEAVKVPNGNNSLGDAHLQAFNALAEKMDALATKMTPADPTKSAPQITDADTKSFDAAIAAYQTAIITAAQGNSDLNSSFDSIKEKSKKDGWLLAGAWFMKLVNQQNKVSQDLFAIPTATSVPKNTTSVYSERWRMNAPTVNDFIKNSSAGAQLGISAENERDGSSDKSGMKEDSGFWVKALTNGLNLGDLKSDPRHPIIILKDLGDRMVSWAGGGAISISVVAAAAGLSQGSGVAVFAAIGGFISMILFAGLSFGLTMNYYIPMIPFILWIGALIGWMIVLFEAVIAAPLWAVMHIHPSGDDMAGRGANGYMLVLSLLLRPGLMIAGISAAMLLLIPIAKLVNLVFLDTFIGSQNGSMGWLFGTLAALAVYVAIMIGVVHKSFALIHIIPDQVMRWAGGGGDGMIGQSATQMEQHSKGSTGAAAAISGKLGSDAMGRVQQVAGQVQGQKLQRQQNDLSRAESSSRASSSGYGALSQMGGEQGGNLPNMDDSKRSEAKAALTGAISQNNSFMAKTQGSSDPVVQSQRASAGKANEHFGKGLKSLSKADPYEPPSPPPTPAPPQHNP